MKAITYEPSAGTHIRVAATEAKRIATVHRKPVRFRFNDVSLTATRKTSVDSLLWTFDLVMSQHVESYRNSRRGREAARARREQVAARQRVIDWLCHKLDEYVSNLSDVVAWCDELSELGDDVDVTYSKPEIVRKLTEAGYVSNQHCGRPQEDFDNRQILGEYIVGQAISCLEHGLPPHPITRKFAATFARLKELT